jgi:hypothetical protein
VAEHNAEVIEFETYMACEAWARQAIVKTVDEEWISEKHDEDIGYQAVKFAPSAIIMACASMIVSSVTAFAIPFLTDPAVDLFCLTCLVYSF